jgi:hypothetical protein
VGEKAYTALSAWSTAQNTTPETQNLIKTREAREGALKGGVTAWFYGRTVNPSLEAACRKF